MISLVPNTTFYDDGNVCSSALPNMVVSSHVWLLSSLNVTRVMNGILSFIYF